MMTIVRFISLKKVESSSILAVICVSKLWIVVNPLGKLGSSQALSAHWLLKA